MRFRILFFLGVSARLGRLGRLGDIRLRIATILSTLEFMP